jgi:dihydrofolate reductase
MKKIVWFMHVTLDGFVCGPNGEMDWIHVDKDLFDYAGHQTDNADVALYGRVTWNMMEAYWPTAGDKPNASEHDVKHSKWYNRVPKFVVSRSMKDKQVANTTFLSDNIKQHVDQLKNNPGKNIVMFGSPSIGHILTRERLIDEYWLFINPIILGKGKPLFNGEAHVELRLLSAKQFDSGVAALHYEKVSV